MDRANGSRLQNAAERLAGSNGRQADIRRRSPRRTAVLMIVALLAGLGLGGLAPLSAQDEAEAFRQVHERWNAANAELERMGEAYRTAAPGDLPALRESLLAQFARIKEMVPELRQSAAAAFSAQPGAEPAVVDVLMRLAATDLQEDRLERGAELIELLRSAQLEIPGLADLAGRAAYMGDDFVAAKEFWNQAKTEGAISQGSNQLDGTIDDRIREFDIERQIREREAQADDLPLVLFETSKGELTIALYENEAPNTVANFITLVEKGYYDGLTFHRVIPEFMAQGGCNIGNGTGGPGYEIPCECLAGDYRRHYRGTLSMAHRGANTGGSQFFLTFRATPHLDGKHTVFGRVVKGLDVLAELQRIDPQRPSGVEPDRIVRATVLRKRPHDYVVRKVE